MLKYPRTKHLEGSRKQKGDEDLDCVLFSKVKGKFLICEEKLDGSNCGISFENGKLYLQSRGHYLEGHDQRQFDLFKSWAFTKASQLYDVLKDRYIMYGEWVYAKHTEFYDDLPHYFLEFDIFDREKEIFLGTTTRHEMLKSLNIVSVPVLKQSTFEHLDDLLSLIGPSKFKSSLFLWSLKHAAKEAGVPENEVLEQTDLTNLMEGLYIKDETSGNVDERYKIVRSDFLQVFDEKDDHWAKRPIIINRLKSNISIWD